MNPLGHPATGASRPKVSPRTRRLGIVAVLLVAAGIFVMAGSGVGQINDKSDPRNLECGEDAGGCNASKDCWMHHRGEGMSDAFILVPIVPQQLAVGEEQTMALQVINPWKNHLGGISVKANMLTAEGEDAIVRVPGATAGEGSGPQDTLMPFEGTYAQNSTGAAREGSQTETLELPFQVESGASAVRVRTDLRFNDAAPDPLNLTPKPGITMRTLAEGQTLGTKIEPDGEGGRATTRNATIMGADLRSAGAGDWIVELAWTNEFSSSYTSSVEYAITVDVIYGSLGGASKSYDVPGVDPEFIIDPGTSRVYEIPLDGLAQGTQTVEIEVRAYTWYQLKHQDGLTADYDNYTRYATFDVEVGNQFVPSEASVVEVKAAGEDARLVAGEVTGFATAILLLPSLLLGGTFGKGSRKMFNALLGGAKRRVMYHNVISLGITIAAVVHVVMFMLEIRYTIVMGLLWGGLAALALLVLGLTGYYQIPLIQRHGYKWWRVVHLTFGILVVIFATWHSIADGPDFNFLRQELPQWLLDLNLAEK